ncbi:hypothetical protein RIF29_26955 [Crotalaria pallida]|uniref:BRCT domain-containing protein n=1 Tax=Crotalaria pallida TaxID=3830 RepID=A0AAN9I550_CROPI
MASLGLRPPHFSEDVAWLPSWLHNSMTCGSNEFVRVSQVPFKQDLAPSQENCNNCKEMNAISREEDRYKSCHLFLSGEDSSPVSVAPSPGNVVHFSLRLSSDVDSLLCPTQDLNVSHDAVALSKVQSLQHVQTSVDLIENLNSMIDHRACDHNMLPDFIPETASQDASKSQIDTIGSVRQKKEKSNVKCFEGDDISTAVELSIAASEALVIHDLVKMESVSETICADAVLEVALRVKQARLKGLDDDFHSSSEESACSDSLSDLDDFLMEDAYEDIGLSLGVSIVEQFYNSAISQAKGVSNAENYSGCNKKHSDKSKQKQLEVEVEMLQKPDLPLDSLCCEREMHSDDCGLGSNTPKHFENDLPISNQFIENNSNVLAINQTNGLDMVDLASTKPQNCVNSSLVETSGNFSFLEKENWATCFAPERYRSCWLGGWTCKDVVSSSLNQNNVECILKFLVRETSFLTESAATVPDESSCVQKDDPKCTSGSQRSILSEGLQNKNEESTLHSQDVVRCSSLSLIDPLCSVVPCSISSQHANFKTHIDEENDSEKLLPFISELVDNFQRISNKNITFDSRDEQIMPVLHVKDIPITATKVFEQMPEKLTRVEHTCQKQFNSLQTCSTILPNKALDVNNLTLLPTNQSMSGAAAASLGTQASESLFASKHDDENKNEEKHGHFVDHKSIIETTDDKSPDVLKPNAADTSYILAEPTQERKSPLILNRKARCRVLGPKTVVNDISVQNHMKHHVVPQTVIQYQQNNNLNTLQVECNEFHDGHVSVRKRVHFSENVEELHLKRRSSKLEPSYKKCFSIRAKRQRVSKSLTPSLASMKHSLTSYSKRAVSKFIFQGTEFLLTGLSSQKEREMELLIRKSGGLVLSDIPSPPNSRGKRCSTLSCVELPIILCIRKLQTTKFLYGCAVGAPILTVDWLTDCLASGTILQPERYMILPHRNDMKWSRFGMAVHRRIQKHIFERVGIMLHGNHSFCTKLASIIKHGGGQVFKTLQWLVRSTDDTRTSIGAIVVEDKSTISRHLARCALERGIPIMPSSWIIKSLYSGVLLPFTEENNASPSSFVEVPSSMDMSQEI